MSARAEILARVRGAVGDAVAPEVPAPVLRGAGDVDLFAARAADYRATVTRTDDADRTVAERLAAHDIDGVVTGCACAIAETGTIVLVGQRRETLLPDLHVCVVRADQVLADVPDAIAFLRGTTEPITFVSGPSATSDIELERVEGVHGPRRLEIVIVS